MYFIMLDLIVKASVKASLPDHNVSSDFYDALDEGVAELLEIQLTPICTVTDEGVT